MDSVIAEILKESLLTSGDDSCFYKASDAFENINAILSKHRYHLSVIGENTLNTYSHTLYHRSLSSSSSEQLSTATIVTYVLLSTFCLVSAALAAGLTQGMLSINPLELKVKLETGSETDKIASKRILPIVNDHHILLVTLLLFNACANESLPIFLDALVPSWLSIVLSVTLVLICGEIVPSAIFTGPKQLQIASCMAPFVRVLIIILSPIAYPTAKLLDYLLGRDEGVTVFNRTEMAALVGIIHSEGRHETDHKRRGTLMHADQVTILQGALNYIDKKVEDVMSKVEDTFMLPIGCCLNVETVSAIFQAGFSRVPIYESTKNDIVGLLLVKDLIFIDPEDEIPLKNFINVFGRQIISVWGDDKLGDVLSLFQKKRSHLAIVHSVDDSGDGDPVYVTIGLITLEDVVEEILGAEIEDEHDTTESSPHEHALALLHSRDMDHIRLEILGSGNVATDKTIAPTEAREIAKMLLQKMPLFCEYLLTYAPIELEQQKIEAYLQWKIQTSTVNFSLLLLYLYFFT
jgi:metal transporter CNNM